LRDRQQAGPPPHWDSSITRCHRNSVRQPENSEIKQLAKRYLKKADRVVRRVLANGTERTYRYPAYERRRRRAAGETIGDMIAAWQRSPEWKALASNTQAGYSTYARPLMRMQHVAASRVERKQIVEIRNALAEARGVGASTGFVRTASALFGWAIENGWLKSSPTLRMKRLKGGTLPAWSDTEAEMAIRLLPEHLRRPVVLALYSGQRRGDLIRMTWGAYDGKALRLRQGKTGAILTVPVHPALREELDTWRAETSSTMILVNKFGRPWQESNLSKQLGEALAKIEGFGVGRNIHGLRKLAAVRLAECGCTLHEIGAITGHKSLAMLQLYTAGVDQEKLAEAAIIRLAGRKITTTQKP
jgi:integrase